MSGYGLPYREAHPAIRDNLSHSIEGDVKRLLTQFQNEATQKGMKITSAMLHRLSITIKENYIHQRQYECYSHRKFVSVSLGRLERADRGKIYTQLYYTYQIPKNKVKEEKDHGLFY